MPIYSYRCPEGHEFTVHFSSFALAESHVKGTDCMEGSCGEHAKRQMEAPAVHFLGSGWTNPVPSGRTQTRGSDTTKVAAEVTQEFGAKNWVQSVKASKPA